LDTTELSPSEKIAQELDSFQTRMDRKHYEEKIRVEWFKSLYEATGVKLPYDAGSMQWVTVYHPHPEKWDADKEKMVTDYAAPQEINVDATNKLLAKVTQHASRLGHPVNKNYSSKYYTHEIVLEEDTENKWNNVTVTYQVDRESVCKKVVTGTEEVPEQVIPAHTKENFEWVCEKISYLGMDTADSE